MQFSLHVTRFIYSTGANSPIGIGRAAAHQFAHNGARAVYLCDYFDDYLESHKAELLNLYPQVDIHVRCFDAGDEASVKDMVQDVTSKYGRLDIMFANHGIVGTPAVYTDIDSNDFMETLKTNALGAFLCAKYAAIDMKRTNTEKPKSGGSIICTASVAGLRSNAGSTDYSASKAAVISIVQTLAYQLAGTNIRINAICPGIIETGMTLPMYDNARERGTVGKIGQINPLGRGAVADEVARVALFLGSEEASYINGQALAVCGGLSAGHPFIRGKLA